MISGPIGPLAKFIDRGPGLITVEFNDPIVEIKWPNRRHVTFLV